MLGKAKRLLLPYLVVSTAAFIPKMLLSQYSVRGVELSLSGYLHSLIYPFNNPILILWFVPVLFLLFIPAFWLMRWVARLPVWGNLLVLLSLLVLYRYNPVDTQLLALSRVVEYLGFFYAGMLAAKYYDYINQLNRWWVLISSLAILVALNFNPDPFLSAKGYRLLTVLFGHLFSFSLAMAIADTKWDFFRFMGHYSYQVYLLSWFFQVGFRIFYQLEIFGYWVTFALMLLGGVLGPLVVSRFISRHTPYLKSAVGL